MDEKILQTLTDTIVDEVHPEPVILFGSHAKGTALACSDVDLLVVMPKQEGKLQNRRRLTGRLYRRLAAIPVPKDILVYSHDELEHWRNVPDHIIATGLREGRCLYGRT